MDDITEVEWCEFWRLLDEMDGTNHHDERCVYHREEE
jgi:hypothetical protein